MSLARPNVLVAAVLLALLLPAAPALAGPLDKAKAAARDRRWAEAATEYGAALTKAAGNREAALGLAQAAAGGALEDWFGRAEEALLALVEKKEDDREANLALGELYLAMAAAKTDDQARRFTYEDARTAFERVAKQDPKDEAAAVGWARCLYWLADFEGALGVLDTFLAQGSSKGPALYWKGQVFYLGATDAYRNAGKLDDAANAAFQKALGAYEGAVKADPAMYDAWMQLGYSAQYLGDTGRATEAYEKAMDLDPQNALPLKGIEALYTYDPDVYAKKLDELARLHPKNVAIHFFRGYLHLGRKSWSTAIEAFKSYVSKVAAPGRAWLFLGMAYTGSGDGKRAAEAYSEALKQDPDDIEAAAALDAKLRAEHFLAAKASPSNAKLLVEAYAPLMKLAPRNPFVVNNLAFMLREVADAHGGGEGAWRAVLDECVRLYVEASTRVEACIQGPEEQIPYATRHAYAGIVNDTGLMFFYYPAVVDLAKAEAHYDRALELSEDGYFDAYTNLLKLLVGAARWQEAYDLAASCAESLRDEDGKPHATGQAHARGMMEKLRRDHGVGGE
jgi:tetratricopeptide (TPR) repeat protein